MTRSKALLCRAVLGLALVTGCAQVPKQGGFEDVRQVVSERANYRIHWNQGLPEDRQVEEAIDALLREELTPEAAVQIALLNNPALQAAYENLGITQADVVEAGLLENPAIFGQARFPDKPPSGTNLDLGIVQNFLNILMLPARKKIAVLQFEEVKARVADTVLRLAAETEVGYYNALAATNIRQMRKQIAEAAGASYEFAGRLYAAGNISDLDLANEQGLYEDARIALAESETRLISARENLTRLMGLWGHRTAWTIPSQLPDIPADELPLERLETLAVEKRSDLEAARREVEVMAQALGTTVAWRWIGKAEVTVSGEKDTDGQWVVGPGLIIELPIFNQRQADIARGEARLRRSVNELTALAVGIRSEVRSLRDRLIMQRRLIEHYKRVIMPLRERIVELTLQQYNYMLVGTFDLLMAKHQEFETYQKYLEAVRDYWITRAELRRAVGGSLPTPESAGELSQELVPEVPPDAASGRGLTHSHGSH